MQPHVVCPCGNAIDCDHLEMVVTLPCPVCSRELTLEFAANGSTRKRLVLTVIEGAMLREQRFVAPVAQELIIGGAPGAWLTLPDGQVADRHCRLRVEPGGAVRVNDLNTATGTWIERLRVLEGVLGPGQVLRVGAYALQACVEDVDAGAISPFRLPSRRVTSEVSPLPVMRRVADGGRHPVGWVARNRFSIFRVGLIAFAWLGAVYHWRALPAALDAPMYAGLGVGAVFAGVFSIIARRVSLTAAHWNLAASVACAFVALADTAMLLPAGAIASALLACTGVIMTGKRIPRSEYAVLALALIGLAVVTIGVGAGLAFANVPQAKASPDTPGVDEPAGAGGSRP